MQPAPWWLRVFLITVLIEALVIGLSGYLIPEHMTIPVDISPLNARFVGALYLTGAVALAAGAMARTIIDTRIVLFAIVLVTLGLLLLSLAYWDQFGDGLSPYVWVVSYVIDPIVGTAIIAKLGLWRGADQRAHTWSPVFMAIGALWLTLGFVLLFLPDLAVRNWPWAMNDVLARMYSAFFIGYGFCSLLVAAEARSLATRAMRASFAALGPLVIVASLQHTDRFDSGPREWLWYIGFAVPSLLVLWTLLPQAARRAAEVQASGAGTSAR